MFDYFTEKYIYETPGSYKKKFMYSSETDKYIIFIQLSQTMINLLTFKDCLLLNFISIILST